MTHGNIATHVGTCQVCGREQVDLCQSRPHPRTGERILVCVDEFACFRAYLGETS